MLDQWEPPSRLRETHLDRRSATYLLLQAAHHRAGLPGRFTPAAMGRHVGISESKAQRFLKGYNHAWVDRGKLPPEDQIAQVAAGYGISTKLLRDRLLQDAGLNDATDLDALEAAANTILQYVQAVRREQREGPSR